MRRHIKANVSWVGYIDWELETFHGEDLSTTHGSSQNAYLVEEEKTVLIDTAWTPHATEFIDNLKSEIDLSKIDFIVANHGECDHSGSLPALMAEIPGTPIYCTANAVKSLEGQYGKRGWNFQVVKTGDSVDVGNGKQLVFVEMRMLHWPDSMACYLTGDNILFSNDAFGQHFAVGELFNDLADQELLYREALKYFVNILNPFAPILVKKLQEIAALNLPIDIIAPSHGVIWRDNPMQIVETYAKWADPEPGDQVTVAYGTMWEGTAKIAHAIAAEIARQSPETTVKVFNVEKADKNEVMVEVWKSKAIAVGSPTVVNNMLAGVEGWLAFARQLKFKNKRAAAFGCYGWSGESVKLIQAELDRAGFEVVEESVRSLWNPEEEDFAQIPALVSALLGLEDANAVEDAAPSAVQWKCPCGYVYDPAVGDPDSGIEPGTAFEDIPDDWVCPTCGLGKEVFEKIE